MPVVYSNHLFVMIVGPLQFHFRNILKIQLNYRTRVDKIGSQPKLFSGLLNHTFFISGLSPDGVAGIFSYLLCRGVREKMVSLMGSIPERDHPYSRVAPDCSTD